MAVIFNERGRGLRSGSGGGGGCWRGELVGRLLGKRGGGVMVEVMV